MSPGVVAKQLGGDLDPAGGQGEFESPATFVVGRDRNNITTLPAPDCSTTPPTERFFTIAPPRPLSGCEQFCVLLTKSEIEMAQIKKLLEAAEGDLLQRVAQVFGEKMVGADAANFFQKNGRLAFDASASSKTVLPVVFYVNRN